MGKPFGRCCDRVGGRKKGETLSHFCGFNPEKVRLFRRATNVVLSPRKNKGAEEGMGACPPLEDRLDGIKTPLD
jgi:hypothetical protein